MPDIFSPDKLREAVHQTLASAFQAIPEGKRGALLVFADGDKAELLLAANINGHWQVAIGAGRPWDGPVYGTVAIAGSW